MPESPLVRGLISESECYSGLSAARCTGVAPLEMTRRLLASACVYNPLSVLQAGRLADIQRVLRANAVLVLPSTRLRQSLAGPVRRVRHGPFSSYDFGYSARGNRSSGCMLSLRGDCFPDATHVMVDYPKDVRIQGRGGVVRTRDAVHDVAWIVAYIPPTFDGKQAAIFDNVLAWVQHVIDHLPARRSPVLLTDANVRLGYLHGPHGVHPIRSHAFVHPTVVKNASGTRFREMLEHEHLQAASTSTTVPTFYSMTVAGVTSTIDYICVPVSWVDAKRIHEVQVMQRQGDRLQLIHSLDRRDHHPVRIRIEIQLALAPREESQRWDRDARMQGVLKGTRRNELMGALNAKCTDDAVVWQALRSQSSPSVMYDHLSAMLRDAAFSVYGATGTNHSSRRQYVKRRDAALEARRELRATALDRTSTKDDNDDNNNSSISCIDGCEGTGGTRGRSGGREET